LPLQGKVTGLNITSSTGRPTSARVIKIRGINSIASKNQPLYVIDGIPVSAKSKEFKKLKPNRVKDIKVLKNSAAQSIYGNRGQNGVIIISTKNNAYQSEAYKEINLNI